MDKYYKLVMPQNICLLYFLVLSLCAQSLEVDASQKFIPHNFPRGFKGVYKSTPNQISNIKVFDYLSIKDKNQITLFYLNSLNMATYNPKIIQSVFFELYDSDINSHRSVIVTSDITKLDRISQMSWQSNNSQLIVQIKRQGKEILKYKCIGKIATKMIKHSFLQDQLMYSNVTSSMILESEQKQGPCSFQIQTQNLKQFITTKHWAWFNTISVSLAIITSVLSIVIIVKITRGKIAHYRFSSITVFFLSVVQITLLIQSGLMVELEIWILFLFVIRYVQAIIVGFLSSVIIKHNQFRNEARLKKLYIPIIVVAIIYILIRILVYYFNLWLNIMIALGLFLPQIIKNFKYRLYQNIRFEYIFLLGIQSYYPLYFYACPYNVYLNEASSSDFIIWSAVNCICIFILMFQKLLGSKRFFNQKAFKEKFYCYAYQYVSNEGQQIPTCPICLQLVTYQQMKGIDVIISTSSLQQKNQQGKQQLIQSDPPKNLVYQTPCLHLYHQGCLFQWIKNQPTCPVCNSILPPLLY